VDHQPQIDDGRWRGSLTCFSRNTHLVPNVIGGTRETTTGVIRLRAMAKDGTLNIPSSRNDAGDKHFFDNRYGTGRSTIDGIIPRDKPADSPACEVVVAGYGWCGKRVDAAKGLGADVIVTEINAVRGIEASWMVSA